MSMTAENQRVVSAVTPADSSFRTVDELFQVLLTDVGLNRGINPNCSRPSFPRAPSFLVLPARNTPHWTHHLDPPFGLSLKQRQRGGK